MENLILLTDSYKASHHVMYPPGTERVYSYLEARSPAAPDFPEVVFFGLQYYLKRYLAGAVVTPEMVEGADAFIKAHMGAGVFNRAGWQYIVEKHGGRLPVSVKAVAEGTVAPRGVVLMTVENTDPRCYWLTGHLETLLLQVWYGSTVATMSREFKKLLLENLRATGDPELVDMKLHDFGFRGSTSVESAGVGGCAHLINFRGTDTLAGLLVARKYYGATMAGYSIPAAEHSTVIAWGRDHEADAYRHMLGRHPTGMLSIVADSYDIDHAVKKLFGGDLKDLVTARKGTLVVRPDSGPPARTLVRCLVALGIKFGHTLNSKGFKVLPPCVRVILGDGVTLGSLPKILGAVQNAGWSGDNVAFGSGGGLLQKVNRDTLRFSFKASSVTVNGEDRAVRKTPAGDPSKHSKAGRLKLVVRDQSLETVGPDEPGEDLLKEVFRDGKVLNETTLDEVRELAFI